MSSSCTAFPVTKQSFHIPPREFFADRPSRAWYNCERQKQIRFAQSRACAHMNETLHTTQLGGKLQVSAEDRLKSTLYAVEFVADAPSVADPPSASTAAPAPAAPKLTNQTTHHPGGGGATMEDNQTATLGREFRLDDALSLFAPPAPRDSISATGAGAVSLVGAIPHQPIGSSLPDRQIMSSGGTGNDRGASEIAEQSKQDMSKHTPQVMMLFVRAQGQLRWYVPAHEASTWTNYCTRPDANRWAGGSWDGRAC